jgi:hypothetical protein
MLTSLAPGMGGRRGGGDPVRRERRVVPGVDDQRRNGDLLEGEPVGGEVGDEAVEDGTLAPGLEGEQQVQPRSDGVRLLGRGLVALRHPHHP